MNLLFAYDLAVILICAQLSMHFNNLWCMAFAIAFCMWPDGKKKKEVE